MLEPLGALAYLATSALNLFSRKQQTEQTSLISRTRQEHEQNLLVVQMKKLKLDTELVNLQKLNLMAQAQQVENQRAQIELAEMQLKLQLQELENQARTFGVQGEMLEVLNLQKVLLFLILFVALMWLSIQVFPVVSPWLKIAFSFILEEVNALKDGCINLLEPLPRLGFQAMTNIFEILSEVASSVKTWFGNFLPLLISRVFQLLSQFWLMLSEAFSDVFIFLKSLVSNTNGLTGGLIAVVICGLCSLSLK